MPASDLIRERLVATLRRLAPSFVHGPETAELLADAAQWSSVPGGTTLLRKSEPSDTIFIIVSGLLAVVMDTPDGGERIISRLGVGEVVGEMGCITGQPRTATVRALRSSEILEIAWSDIERIARQDPGILLSICRTVVHRMALAQDGRPPTYQPSTFAIIAVGEGVDDRQFGERFREAIALYGDSFLITEEIGRGTTSDDLNQIEKAHKYVIYLTDRNSPSWTSRCIRQADVVLVLAKGAQSPQPLRKMETAVGANIPIVLVLEWDANAVPSNTAAWVKAAGASRQYHVRDASQIRRVARLLTGNGFGLVLSGGGARGLAHLGVARALRENGIDIDVVMGTSIGAVIGSGIAMEWERDEIDEKIRHFISISPFRDLTIPRTSILAGRHLLSSLQRWFGDLQIEDMPVPYSCISTNLSTGVLAVHKSGDLKTWIRASAAIPGIFPPVVVDHNVHVDGSVLNNMPADKMRETGVGFVLGIDVGGGTAPEGTLPAPAQAEFNLLELLVRVGSIGDGALATTRRKHCDMLILPDVSSVGLLNFKAYQRAIDAGFKATLARIDEISNARPSALLSETMAGSRL